MNEQHDVKPITEHIADAINYGAVWTVGRSPDGRYFLAEQWPDDGGRLGWLSWHDDLTGCVDDMRSRIASD